MTDQKAAFIAGAVASRQRGEQLDGTPDARFPRVKASRRKGWSDISEAHEKFRQMAGFITGRRTGPEIVEGGVRDFVTLYLAEMQGIDPKDGGKYLIICEQHGTTLNVNNLRSAKSVLVSGSIEFCDCCRGQCAARDVKCVGCGKGGDDAAN